MDAIDHRLLGLLREDSSLPLKSLAAAVSLSVSSVRERIVRLRERGVIRRYTIEVAPEVEPLTAICLLRLARTPDMDVVGTVSAMPEVARCCALAGEIDLLVEIEAEGPAAINAIRDRIAALPGVLEVTTSLVLTRY